MVELISRSEDKSLAHIQPVLFDSLRYFRSTPDNLFLLPVHLTHFRFSCLAFHSIETKGIILSMGGTNQILKMISTCNREMF